MLKRTLQTANRADRADRADRTDRTDHTLLAPEFRLSFRETLTNSFMTYHAIDFDKYPILQYYAIIFSLRKK